MSKIYSPEELNCFSRETLAAVILSMQDQLDRENPLSDLGPDDRKKQRQITVKPLAEAFQEEALKVFLNDGEFPLDNNATEGVLELRI